MLKYTEKEAWKKTPYQIIELFKYHKEYNPLQFGYEKTNNQDEQIDDIDKALGGL